MAENNDIETMGGTLPQDVLPDTLVFVVCSSNTLLLPWHRSLNELQGNIFPEHFSNDILVPLMRATKQGPSEYDIRLLSLGCTS